MRGLKLIVSDDSGRKFLVTVTPTHTRECATSLFHEFDFKDQERYPTLGQAIYHIPRFLLEHGLSDSEIVLRQSR